MYTKEQVIKGLQCCILRNPDDKPRCNDCPFDGNCVNRLKMAALESLIKSDFEVMKEILERSEEYHNDYSYEIQGNDYPTIILHRGTQMSWVDFDNKGNIL